jgi:SAM-dependent methyltransferase
VLDVGSGTGVLAAELVRALGASGCVVAADPSIAMLSNSQPHTLCHRLVARMPGLPFPNATFDAAAASFVISHLADDAAGLTDMIRVCKSRGRVGLTAWGTFPNPAGTLWKQVAMAVEGSEGLGEAFASVIPGEEEWSGSSSFERALREAGLTNTMVVTRDFVVTVSTSDYVAMKSASVEGTLLRRMLTAARWDRFAADVNNAFRSRFGETVQYRRDFLAGVGTKS